MKATNKQIGGNHYKDMKYQPMDFAYDNNLGAHQYDIIKYVCRYKTKGGEEDLDKAIHVLEMLKEREYGHE